MIMDAPETNIPFQVSTAVYWRQTNRFNIKVRSGLITMVFKQTSRLKASDINDSAAITLMGTDVERIVQSQKTIHETWATILEVGIAIWLLERQLLIACVVPAIIAIGSYNSLHASPWLTDPD